MKKKAEQEVTVELEMVVSLFHENEATKNQEDKEDEEQTMLEDEEQQEAPDKLTRKRGVSTAITNAPVSTKTTRRASRKKQSTGGTLCLSVNIHVVAMYGLILAR